MSYVVVWREGVGHEAESEPFDTETQAQEFAAQITRDDANPRVEQRLMATGGAANPAAVRYEVDGAESLVEPRPGTQQT